MKKIDKKGEEKISGGIRFLDKTKIKNVLLAQGYGAVALTPILNNKIIPYKTKSQEIKNPKSKPNDTLETPQPKTEDMMGNQK